MRVRNPSESTGFGKWLVMYSIHDLKLTRQAWALSKVSQANHWMNRVCPNVLSNSLDVPRRDLLRPRAQWRPRPWAPCWTPCCSYRSAWCCCHCRRILSGKAGWETCAKTRQQATLYGWTHEQRSDSSLKKIKEKLHQQTSPNRKTKQKKKSQTGNMYSSHASLPVLLTGLSWENGPK